MFPLSAFALVAIGLSLCAVLGAATVFWRTLRAWIYLPVGLALGAALLAPCETYGCWPLVLAVLILAAALAIAAGQLWGLLVGIAIRRLDMPRGLGVAALIAPTLASSAAVLERQYVPETCRSGLPVEMAEKPFTVEPSDAALFRWQPGGSGERFLRYAPDRSAKDDAAALCRMADDEGRLSPHRIDFGATGLTICATEDCSFARHPQLSIEEVDRDDPHKPVSWFGDQTRDDILWSGDETDGWICFLPSGSVTWINCTRWVSPTPGLRVEAAADRSGDRPPDALVSELDQTLGAFLDRLRWRDSDP